MSPQSGECASKIERQFTSVVAGGLRAVVQPSESSRVSCRPEAMAAGKQVTEGQGRAQQGHEQGHVGRSADYFSLLGRRGNSATGKTGKFSGRSYLAHRPQRGRSNARSGIHTHTHTHSGRSACLQKRNGRTALMGYFLSIHCSFVSFFLSPGLMELGHVVYVNIQKGIKSSKKAERCVPPVILWGSSRRRGVGRRTAKPQKRLGSAANG